jgi:hypothetical protein
LTPLGLARQRQHDYKALVIRIATFLLVAAALLAGCRSHRYRQEQSAVYEGRPVEVLPPDTGVPPPPPEPPATVVRQQVRPSATPLQPQVQTQTAAQTMPSATPRATPRSVAGTYPAPQFPVAKPVPGKPGFVYSPFESNGTMIDVTGYASGTKVKDPGTNKIFIVP